MRKLLSAIFCALTFVASAQTYSRYDINRDGDVSVEDLTLVVNAILGRINYPVLSVSLSDNRANALLGYSFTLTATVEPAEADQPTLLWTSSDEEVATVADGKVTPLAAGVTTITATTTDGSNLSASCEVTIIDPSNDYEFVDMGLPSGTLWATCNVGAGVPTDNGSYFAWGETEPRPKPYLWSSYKWMQEGTSSETNINKYQIKDNNISGIWYQGTTFVGDDKNILDPQDDAATVNMGFNWQMPTVDQYLELLSNDNCIVEEVGNGIRVTSKYTQATLFFPAAGFYEKDTTPGVYYWTREHSNNSDSPNTTKVCCVHVGNYSKLCLFRERYLGMPIRAVRK